MALIKTGVFLASRFGEFSELRSRLRDQITHYRNTPFAAFDLNHGVVSHRPPLHECLANVRCSEFMILLSGDTYGMCAPGRKKSFTQLEYEEAVREKSSTRVLVF